MPENDSRRRGRGPMKQKGFEENIVFLFTCRRGYSAISEYDVSWQICIPETSYIPQSVSKGGYPEFKKQAR